MSNLITTISWGQLIERIRLRLYNGWASIASNLEDNEIVLYLQEAIAVVITQQSNQGIQTEGVRNIPEGFITTFVIPSTNVIKNYTTGDYEVKLPHPPINLPLGYSVVSPYFAVAGQKSIPLIAIHPYQRGYSSSLPTPNYGVYYWVENDTMYLDFAGNSVGKEYNIYVPMLSPRSKTGQDTDTIHLPDDSISYVFDMVIARLTQRLQVPSDNVNDGNSAPTQRQS